MSFHSYSYSEFVQALVEQIGEQAVEEFNERCSNQNITPNYIIIWSIKDSHDDNIVNWVRDAPFKGRVNQHWQAQVEFEQIEDVILFKLRWFE